MTAFSLELATQVSRAARASMAGPASRRYLHIIMDLIRNLGIATAAVGFLGWLLRTYLDRRLASEFAKLDKLYAVTLELTKTRLTAAYDQLNDLQQSATSCRNALRRLAADLSPPSALEMVNAFDDLEANLYRRELIVPSPAWKAVHIFKKQFEMLVTKIRVHTPEAFVTYPRAHSLCDKTLKLVEQSHPSLQETLRHELVRLEQ